MNYPGLELWKFLNLAIFLTAGIVILRKPISNALSARSEGIKRDLAEAQAQKDQAGQKLAEAESLIAGVDADVQDIRNHAEREAEAEQQRQAAAGEQEIARLKAQATREVEQARKTAHKALQQFLASRSVEIATQSVRRELKPEDDLRLIKERIGELRRAQH
ncbi:MAG TPA: ATP synthase F0 subunit B [Pyrinomonadaceae bacterium]